MPSVEPEGENALAGRLIERLLVDPVFRAEFRRDPAGACVVAGLPGLAGELGGGGGMETLELRESRSSLAGVVMAAAVEGLSVAEAQAFVEHGVRGLHGVRVPGRLGHGVRVPSEVQKVRGLEHRAVGRVHRLEHEVRAAGHGAGAGSQASAPGNHAAASGGLAAAGPGRRRLPGRRRRMRTRWVRRRPPRRLGLRWRHMRPVARRLRRVVTRRQVRRSRPRPPRAPPRRVLRRRSLRDVRVRARRCRGRMRPEPGTPVPEGPSLCPAGPSLCPAWSTRRRRRPAPARGRCRWPESWSHRRCRPRLRRRHSSRPEPRIPGSCPCWEACCHTTRWEWPVCSPPARRCTCRRSTSSPWTDSRWARTTSRRETW